MKLLWSRVAQVKHLEQGSRVQEDIWTACKDHVLSRYNVLESIARQCYPAEAAHMLSAGQLRELFKIV
eukprot:4889119-Pyramimonas_sp.AAC.3